jgi:hypothetical protein
MHATPSVYKLFVRSTSVCLMGRIKCTGNEQVDVLDVWTASCGGIFHTKMF